MSVSAEEADFSRESKKFFSWDPPRSLIASIRTYQKTYSRQGAAAIIARKIAVIRHRFWSVITGADIPINARIGGGLLIPHPNGIVIHPNAEVGPNCLIFQQVTIGVAHGGVPRIGGHVDIGAGAKVLGPVTVGDHVLIGANAVVVSDIPSNSTAIGIPAKIKLRVF